MKEMTVKEMYTLEETIAKDLFEGVTYPWEVLPKISSFILELGASLPEEEYEKRGENVWVARSVTFSPAHPCQSASRISARLLLHLPDPAPWH